MFLPGDNFRYPQKGPAEILVSVALATRGLRTELTHSYGLPVPRAKKRQRVKDAPSPAIQRGLVDFGWTPRQGSPTPPPPTAAGGTGRRGQHRRPSHRARRIAVVVAAVLAVLGPTSAASAMHWLSINPTADAGVPGAVASATDVRSSDVSRADDRASRSGTRATGSPSPSPSARTSERPSPSPKRSPSSSPSPATEAVRYAGQVLTLINAERSQAGCGALRNDSRLAAAALGHSKDMAQRDYFDHNTPEGETPWDRIKAQGYSDPSAENIAAGQPTPQAVVDAWMNSSGHRANILNCSSHATGIGFYRGGSYGTYWTEDFGYS